MSVMTRKSKNSLLDITRKSLDDGQITDCFARFKEAIKDFVSLPQVELIDKIQDEKLLRLQFISLSEAVTIPSITIHATESCRNMETVKSIQVDANNCGTCRGGSTATFNNKNMNKFDQVLDNIQVLFEKNYKEAMEADKKEVEFNEIIEKAKAELQYYELPDKTKSYRKRHGFGKNIAGEFEENRDDRTFDIKLCDLSFDQVKAIGKVIPNL